MSDEVHRTPNGIPLRIGDTVLIKDGRHHSRSSNPSGSIEVIIDKWREGMENRFHSHSHGNHYYYLIDEVLLNITLEKETKSRKENFVNKKRKAVLDIFQYSPK